jgi:hypothetical protein
VNDQPTYKLLLEVTAQATQPPEQVIPDLRRLLKQMLRVYNFKLVDMAQQPFPAKGKPALARAVGERERQ